MNLLTKAKITFATFALIGIYAGYFSGNGYLGAFSVGFFVFAAISLSHDHFYNPTASPPIRKPAVK